MSRSMQHGIKLSDIQYRNCASCLGPCQTQGVRHQAPVLLVGSALELDSAGSHNSQEA